MIHKMQFKKLNTIMSFLLKMENKEVMSTKEMQCEVFGTAQINWSKWWLRETKRVKTNGQAIFVEKES